MTTIGFVSTSVLESKDGIDFSDEKRIESEETKDADKRALEASRQPLWEQLQEKQEKKAEEFEAVRKTIFAPPKGLDDEDVEFLDGVEEARRAAKAKKRDWEAQEMEAFTAARAQQTTAVKADAAPQAVTTSIKAKPAAESAAPVMVVKKRKKGDDNSGSKDKEKKKKKKKKSKEAGADAGPAAGLVAYGSDDSGTE